MFVITFKPLGGTVNKLKFSQCFTFCITAFLIAVLQCFLFQIYSRLLFYDLFTHFYAFYLQLFIVDVEDPWAVDVSFICILSIRLPLLLSFISPLFISSPSLPLPLLLSSISLLFLLVHQVKNTRGIHFCQIVSVDRLQRQLAEDVNRPALCKAMTQLLLNSYYPQANESQLSKEIINQNQVQRCLQFVKENVVASVAFYGTFYQYTSVGSAAKVNMKLII